MSVPCRTISRICVEGYRQSCNVQSLANRHPGFSSPFLLQPNDPVSHVVVTDKWLRWLDPKPRVDPCALERSAASRLLIAISQFQRHAARSHGWDEISATPSSLSSLSVVVMSYSALVLRFFHCTKMHCFGHSFFTYNHTCAVQELDHPYSLSLHYVSTLS